MSEPTDLPLVDHSRSANKFPSCELSLDNLPQFFYHDRVEVMGLEYRMFGFSAAMFRYGNRVDATPEGMLSGIVESRMQDREKTRSDLLSEMAQLRQRLAVLERDRALARENDQALCYDSEGFRHLLQDVPVMVDASDAEGRIVFWNRECEQITGYAAEEILSNPNAWQLLYPDSDDCSQMREEFAKREGDVRRGPWELTGKDGRKRTILRLNISKRFPVPGWVTWGMSIDITAQTHAASEIQESERRFRAIFENAVDGMALVDVRTWTFHEANEALAHMLGFALDQLKGLRIRDVHLPEDMPHIQDELAKQLNRKSSLSANARMKRRDGSLFFADINSIPIWLDGQQYLLGIFRDVTDRAEAERRVRESQQYAESLIDAIPDAITVTDVEGRIQRFNGEFVRRYGFDEDEILGRTVAELAIIDAEQWNRIHKDVLSRLMVEGMVSNVEVAALHKNGTVFPTLLSFSLLRTPSGQPTGVISVEKDITQIKKAERMASEKERLLRATFDAITEAVLLTDPEGTLLALNETASRHLGHTVEELVGTTLTDVSRDILPPHVVENRLQWIHQVVQMGQAMRIEDSAGGLTFDHSLYPVPDTEGQVRQVAVFSKDVSTQRCVETALRDSEAKYRNLVEGIVDVIVSLDCEGRILWVNRLVKDMLGYDSDEVVGRHLSDYMLSDRRDVMEAQFQRVLNGESVRSETVVVARDGALVHVEYSAAPMASEGQAVAIQCVVRDVTQRKQLECKLRESEERYRTLVENAGEAIAMVNHEGVFQFMNATAARRLGGNPGAFVGKTMWDLFPQPIADRQMAQIRQVLETGKGCNSVAMSQVLGEKRWYNTTIEPLRDSAGTVVSGLVIARDIHEFKKAQDELDAYRERMIRAEQLASVGTLSATLAHELTQPLTVIRLSIQNSLKDLERITCPARIVEDLKDGLLEVSSVTAIAERFRNFARRSAEKIATRVAVSTVAQRVMDLLAESARRSKVTLAVEGLDGLPPLCMPEKDLEQLVFALAQNAIQGANGQKNAQFRITGKQNALDVELQFTDNCGGIAAEDLPQVFEPFFTTKPAGEGTGLGLCIVQRVVSDAHGQIRVQTDFGYGTTFVVTLPIPED